MPSHGSLTKAGKARGQNPINWKRQTRKSKMRQRHGKSKGGLPHKHFKKHKNPRTGKRRRYNKWYNETYTVPFLIAKGILSEERTSRR